MDSKRFWIVLAVIAIAFGGILFYSKSKDKPESAGTGNSQGSTNYYGKLDSPVVLTEFVDFQCEACYAYYPHVKQVKEKYKDKVKFQVRNFPITSGHKFAMQAARTAEAAARQGKFWEMHDKIFEGQKTWEQSEDPTSYFDGYAKAIGLDMTKYKADFMSGSVNEVVNKDLKDVQALGGTGTPTFTLNGKKIENPGPSVEALSKVLDEALEKAGIEPPAASQSTPGTQMTPSGMPSSGSSELAPGESPEDHAKEAQR